MVKAKQALLALSLLFPISAQAQSITQPFLGSFWGTPTVPANIDRFADRVFIGPAVVESGQCQMCVGPGAQDWFENLQYNSYNGGAGVYSDDPFAQAIILADPNSVINSLGAPVVALVTAAETLHSNGTIRTQDITVINNSITANPGAWGVYLEAHAVGTSTVTTYGMEIETRNSAGPVHWDPFSAPAVKGNIVGLDIGCGGGLPTTGQFGCGPALSFGGNPMPFDSGILFFSSTIAPSGPGFTIPAIAMPHDYQIQWYSAAGTLSGAITGDATGGMHIQSGRLYVPGGVTWTSPPYGTPAYFACFDINFTLVVSVVPCP